MSESQAFCRVFIDPRVVALLPRGEMRSLAGKLPTVDVDSDRTLVVALASTVIDGGTSALPAWIDAETRYLIVADVPEPAGLRLPSILRLHKPHRRMHVSRDRGVVQRVTISLRRARPWEGILDAYVLSDLLVLVLGDMTVREFPKALVPKVGKLEREEFLRFEIDSAGSFVHWPEQDVHVGVSQLLQAADPMYLTDIEIQRYATEKVSLALLDMRNERGLGQKDIPGLSERHVRRLEREESRLTVDAAEKLARAFDLDLTSFLAELSARISALRDPGAADLASRRTHAVETTRA